MIEYAIIGILIVNISLLFIKEFRRIKRKSKRSSRYAKLNDKISNLDYICKECMLKNDLIENRIDFIQVHLDRYVKWLQDSHITLPNIPKDLTKPTESIKNELVNMVKDSKKGTTKPSKLYVDILMNKHDLSRKKAYNKAYYELNKKQ
jgi:hypothetical protein